MERRFAALLAFACVLFAAFPTVYSLLATHPGQLYTGFQTNVDDHMVYSAWTWQAAHGRLTFDNRFAVDPQPGLTFHLYFLLLGQLARAIGVIAAMTVGRLVFTFAFALLLAKLVRRLRPSVYGTKLILVSVVVAGGVGFLPAFWRKFGNTSPIDVWQPEGFVAPSMLTNGLFMVSLCLILSVFLSVLAARRGGWKPVVAGALAMAALMNIHSYDALLVGLVLLGFLASLLAQRLATWAWVFRSILIVLGALPPALWFVHVLQLDEVFRARAATETFSPNFRLVLLGYLPPMAMGFVGLYRSAAREPRKLAGLALAAGTILLLTALSANHVEGYFLSAPAWAVAFLAMVAATALLAERSVARNLIVAWALVGTVAIYFPALFQRKLTMGLSIPWAILAALAVEGLIRHKERSARNLATTVALLTLGLTSFLWVFREIGRATENLSSTARHPVYLSPDVQKIVSYLGKLPGRHVVVSLPTGPTQAFDEAGNAIPDRFVSPVYPDVAPFLSGLAGVYTVAGHWSETPDYNGRAQESSRFLLDPSASEKAMSDEERRAFVARYGIDYAVVPLTQGMVAPDKLGEIVVSGTQFDLVRVRP